MRLSTNLKASQQAFMMPVVLTFMVIITTLGLSLLQVSLQAQSSSIRYSYLQMAHIGSKAAIDYAEEAYELNPSYNGTPEQDLVVTAKYRVTIEVVVLYDQGSNAKRVQAYGRVYIPETDAVADFVRDIQASVIRNGEVIVCATCGTGGGGSTIVDPATYEPLLWLDANEPNSLIKPSVSSQNQYISSLHGSSYDDVVEQRGSDAWFNQGDLSFNSDDLEMSWDGSSRGHQSIGLRFRSLNAPNSANINEAYIQFKTDETKWSGALQLLVEGVSSDDAPTWSGDYAVDNAPKTTATYTWTPPNWNVVGASGANERVDVTSIVQEIVNRGGWSPSNDIAFSIKWVQGAGIRTAESGKYSTGPLLYVDWDTGSGGGYATANGDQVGTWVDKSINNNDAAHVFGSAPVLTKGAINGLDAVRFSNNGNLLSSLSSVSSNGSITAFVVMLPRTTSTSDARFLTAMNSAENNDSTVYDGVVLFRKLGTSSTLQQYYRNQNGESISSGVDNDFSIYTSRLSDIWVERLLENGVDNYSSLISNINYDIDQIYIGGGRSNSSGAYYADADIAEVIVYDKGLSCEELNEVEAYLGDRYAVPVTIKTC